MHAVRNIRLCTKDCLCLYVCPSGATDTETGQIDFSKCISGCRLCVDACPSHAISLMPDKLPPQKDKEAAVAAILRKLCAGKMQQSQIALSLAEASDDPAARNLAKAIAASNQFMAEDFLREAGFLLPQSQNVIDLLQNLLSSPRSEDFPKEIVERLLDLLQRSNT